MAEALKPSRVVKVCKDGQNFKRRTPFEMSAARQERIDACTIHIEGPAVQAPEAVARMLAKYGVKDIRVSKNVGEYAVVELENVEQVRLAIRELSSESLKILSSAQWQEKKQEMKNIERELRDVLMMQ